MPIVGVIIALVIGGALLAWRIHRTIKAGRAIAETAQDVRAAWRRHSWRHRSAARPMEAVDDPMLAAAVVLVLLVRCDRDVTNEDRAHLTAEMARVFQVADQAAVELLGEAEFLVRDLTDYPRWVGRMAVKLAAACSVEECDQVLQMADAAVPADPPSERRRMAIARYRENARLA